MCTASAVPDSDSFRLRGWPLGGSSRGARLIFVPVICCQSEMFLPPLPKTNPTYEPPQTPHHKNPKL
jgi:hypothetical protein